MRQQGWKLATENPGELSTLMRWTKGPRSCVVEFADDEGSTEIWIRSVAAAKGRSATARQ